MKNVEIFENVTAKRTFCVKQFFFRAKTILKVAIIKTKSATIPFFLFSSFLPSRPLFSFLFPSLVFCCNL